MGLPAIILRPDECCAVCGLRIFSNEHEAALAGVAFYAHLNGRFDGKCTGCANGNLFIGIFAEKEMSKRMNETTRDA